VDSVLLNGTVAPAQIKVTGGHGTIDGLDLKFSRDEVMSVLEPGDAVAVVVTGEIGGHSFAASDLVRVIGTSIGEDGAEDRQTNGGPESIALESILPNPFNPTTVIRYRAAAGVRVTIAIFDVAGRRVRSLVDGAAAGGEATVTWDGHDDAGRAVASGVYFCRLRSADVTRTGKMLLVK
jgi:hypothetical protein